MHGAMCSMLVPTSSAAGVSAATMTLSASYFRTRDAMRCAYCPPQSSTYTFFTPAIASDVAIPPAPRSKGVRCSASLLIRPPQTSPASCFKRSERHPPATATGDDPFWFKSRRHKIDRTANGAAISDPVDCQESTCCLSRDPAPAGQVSSMRQKTNMAHCHSPECIQNGTVLCLLRGGNRYYKSLISACVFPCNL